MPQETSDANFVSRYSSSEGTRSLNSSANGLMERPFGFSAHRQDQTRSLSRCNVPKGVRNRMG